MSEILQSQAVKDVPTKDQLTLNPLEEEDSGEKTKIENHEEDASVNVDTPAKEENSINKSGEGNVGHNEGEEDDSDEEELPPGLLERPIEILKDKRVRKKITRFTYDEVQTSPSSEKKRNVVAIPEGTGVKLGQHPRVEFQLNKNKAEDLKIIHKFFFGLPGDLMTCKKNIREFKGFTVEKDSREYEKKEELIGKFTVNNLKWAMEVCDIPLPKGTKDDLIDAFMTWAMCPQPQDKPLPDKKKKSQVKKKKTVKRKGGKHDGQSTFTGTSSKKPRKRGDSEGKAKNKTSAKKKNVGSTPSPTKKAKIKIQSKSTAFISATDSSSDDEPLQKKKGPPTNTEIRTYVENLLRGADLEVITMKSVFQQVYEHYPEYDLGDRKAFIKETVKKIIS